MQKTSLIKVLPYLLLPLFIYISIVVFTTVGVFRMSLQEWRDGAFHSVGLQHFEKFPHDRFVHTAALNSIKWIVITLIAAITIPFALALLLNQGLKGGTFFKVAFVIPQAVAYTAAGLIWAMIYSPDVGIVNTALRSLGLGGLARPWLGDPNVALYCLIVAMIWLRSGFYMMIYLTRLQSLPADVIDAAKVDGANAWQRLWYVIAPLMRISFVIVVLIDIIASLRTFDIVLATTGGGPGVSTEVLGLRIYREAFQMWNMGYSAAISTVLLTIAMIITVVYLYVIMRREAM